jgi:cell division protein FtsQ
MASGILVLLVAGVRKKDKQHCSAVDIHIRGVQNNFFIDEKDVLQVLNTLSGGNPSGKACNSFHLGQMELELRKNIWIASAQLFFDNNAVLVVDIEEREPIARIFTNTGITFYIDKDLMRLPLSEKFSANLPVFTGFPADQVILTMADSILLKDVCSLSLAIQKDTFCNALIDQIDITANRNFELIPKIGNQIILLGDASNMEEKLLKLRIFIKIF